MFAQTAQKAHEKNRLVNLLASYGITEPVLSAFDAVPREIFVPKNMKYAAYEDHALSIGEGQTTSQPSLVALMLQALDLKGSEKVLEIGTGSGFQAALLGKLVPKVYTLERLINLAEKAKDNFQKLKIKNVKVVVGDGTEGLKEYAPYDAIIVTAAFSKVPQPLANQLKEGGRLVMPVGQEDWQETILYRKENGKLQEIQRLAPVVFVPLIGKHGWGK